MKQFIRASRGVLKPVVFFGEPIGLLVVALALLFQFGVTDWFQSSTDAYQNISINDKLDLLMNYVESIGDAIKYHNLSLVSNHQSIDRYYALVGGNLHDATWIRQEALSTTIYHWMYIVGTFCVISGKFYDVLRKWKEHRNEGEN